MNGYYPQEPMGQLIYLWEAREPETYRCPNCGGELAPEEPVYMGDEGVIGCAACIYSIEAQDALGPDDAA